MARFETNTNGIPTAGNPLRSLSPKTITAIVLMAMMGILWLRVLTSGGSGPSSTQAAEVLNTAAMNPAEAALRIKPVELPVIAGRNDVLAGDFFTSAKWPEFRQAEEIPEPEDDAATQQKRQQARFEDVVKTLQLDAVFQGVDEHSARVCINGTVIAQGQTLSVKTGTETYELTISEIGETQVVLTWNSWNAALKMAESEHVE